MLDRVTIFDQLNTLKEECLNKSISNTSIEILSLEIESIVSRSVLEFIKETGDNYSNQILDITEKNEFIDFKSGYKGQMYAWFKENPIITQKITIDYSEKTNHLEKQKTLQSAALSTVAVVLVYFASGSLIATLAMGVLGLIITIHQKKKGREADIRADEAALRLKMEELVKAIAKEAYDWLDKLEAQSDKVLASFGLNFFDK